MTRTAATLLLAALLLANCAPAPTPTPLPSPTATAMAIPLSDLELEPVLVVSGDLPAGYSGAQVRSTPPDMFDGIRGYEQVIYQQFGNDSQAGGLTVFLFASGGDRDAAYESMTEDFGNTEVSPDYILLVDDLSDLGEAAHYASFDGKTIPLDFIDLAFTHCHALVHIRMGGMTQLDAVTAYAVRLDKRLQAIVCSE